MTARNLFFSGNENFTSEDRADVVVVVDVAVATTTGEAAEFEEFRIGSGGVFGPPDPTSNSESPVGDCGCDACAMFRRSVGWSWVVFDRRNKVADDVDDDDEDVVDDADEVAGRFDLLICCTDLSGDRDRARRSEQISTSSESPSVSLSRTIMSRGDGVISLNGDRSKSIIATGFRSVRFLWRCCCCCC